MKSIEKTIAKREEKMNKSRTAKTYKVMGITVKAWWCVPLVPIVVAITKIAKWWKNRDTWSDKKANRIIMAKLTKCAGLEEDGSIWYATRNWGQWWDNTCKWYDAPFARKYRRDIDEYLENKFQLEGYEKSIEPDDDPVWTWIVFRKK